MITTNQAPIGVPMVRTDRRVDKGWQDWFLSFGRTLTINEMVENTASEFTVPYSVEQGVLTIGIFDDSNNWIETRQGMVIDNVMALPAITSGYYSVSGTLIRRF